MLGHEHARVSGLGPLFQQRREPQHDAGNALRRQLLSECDDIRRRALQWKWHGRVVSVIGWTLHLAQSQVDFHQVGTSGFDLAHDLIERGNRISAAEIHRVNESTLKARDRKLAVGKAIDLKWLRL